MDKKHNPDINWLTKQHWALNKSCNEIADICDCSPSTIRRIMKEYGLPRQRHNKKYRYGVSPLAKDKNWLAEQYWGFELSAVFLSSLLDCGNKTIVRHMRKHNIPIRNKHKLPPQLVTDKNWLTMRYWGFHRSITEISKLVGCRTDTVKRYFEEFNIPTVLSRSLVRDKYGRKRCNTCDRWLPEDSFHKDNDTADSLYFECKDCKKRRYKNNARKRKNRDWTYKQQFLSFFSNGTMRCKYCGEDDITKLNADHTDGDGKDHRKKVGREGINLYKYIVNNDFETEYSIDIVCETCNKMKGYLSDNEFTSQIDKIRRYLS